MTYIDQWVHSHPRAISLLKVRASLYLLLIHVYQQDEGKLTLKQGKTKQLTEHFLSENSVCLVWCQIIAYREHHLSFSRKPVKKKVLISRSSVEQRFHVL